MSFPSSPTNGQIAVINNITYVYSSTTNSWTRQQHTFNNTGPVPPTTNLLVGDIWYNTNDDTVYRYTYDGTSYYWVDIITPTVTTSTTNLNFGTITSNTFTSNTVNTTAVYANSYYFANGSSLTTGSSVPKITSVQVTNASYVANGWQAVSNTGGYIIINGTGFVAGANVVIGTKTITGTYISSTLMQVPVPAQTNGYYTVYVVNPDGGVAINVPGLIYNDVPIFTTGATLPGAVNGSSVSIQLFATDSQSLTYSLASGSLPPGLTLSSSGLISGTVTGVTSATVYNFAIAVTDTYSQVTQQTFNISVSVGDTYFPYTSLLLSASTNSANTSGNTAANTVVDSSYNYNSITRGGNPGQGTFNPFGTTWSNYLNGSSDYLVTPTSSSYGLPNNSSWTIEYWVYLNSLSAVQQVAFFSGGGSNSWTAAHNIDFSINTSGYTAVEYANGTGSPPVITGTTALKINTWNHVAYVYNGSTKTISSFINGVVDINASSMSTYAPSTITPRVTIGRTDPVVSSPTNIFGSGYISNFRITNGTALYTSTFTPSTIPLSVIANTTLLTCQSNRFVDSNTTPATITVTGTPSIQRFNPFGSNTIAYATSSNTYIGSTYFNGTSDYLVLATGAGQILSTTTQNFTVECWVNPLSTAGSTLIWLNGTAGLFAYAGLRLDWNNGSNQIRLLNSQTGSAWDTNASGPATPPGNTWYHVAVTRNGNTANVYLNGILGITTTIGSIYGGTQNQLAQLPNPYWWGGYISNFRVINGVALYTSNFIPPTAPLSVVTNTSILCCQSSQSVTYDANTTPNSITIGGTPRPTKSVPFTQSWAGQFNGTSSYLQTPGNSITFVANNFTMEAWVYPTGRQINGSQIISQSQYGVNTDFLLHILSNGTLQGYFLSGSPYILTSTTVVSLNTWSHVAVTRNSNVFNLWINGANSAAVTFSNSITGSYGPLTIGNSVNNSGTTYFQGYISNLRILNGTAVYTSNFTPSNTPLTAIANTVLLTLQTGSTSNTFIDNSTSALTITANGTPSANVVSMAAPGYSPMPLVDSSSAATIYSGSYYFATSDYLTYPEAAIGTNTFTYEFWAYPTAAGNNTYYKFAGGNSFQIGYNSTTFSAAATTGSWAIAASANPQLNAWNHIALVRTGTGSSQFFLYLNGVLVGTSTSSTTYAAQSSYIGGGPAVNTQVGYISNPRLVIGQALYTSTFTPPTVPLLPTVNIAYSGPSNTALLLSGTNVGAYDSTMINDFVNVGGVSVNSNVKQYGTNSYYFNGSSYLYQANSVNLQSGTGDFTLESWIYPTNASGTQTVIEVGRAVNGTTPGFQIDIISGVFYAYYGSTIASSITGSSASNGTWYHVAVSRASGSLRFFINGTQVGSTGTDNTNYTQGYLWIGANPGGSSYFTGYLQDVRFTRYARYTSNFTVPSTPFIAQ
jgi:hypothetical protein